MKCLKEPLSRLVNKAEKCTGAFFEGRYKSIAVLDEEALLAVCAYIDLNPVAAGIARTPEESEHTSVKAESNMSNSRDAKRICKPRSMEVSWFASIEATGGSLVVDPDRGSTHVGFAA